MAWIVALTNRLTRKLAFVFDLMSLFNTSLEIFKVSRVQSFQREIRNELEPYVNLSRN